MDEYNILRKKNKRKGGFATTAILVSLAIILLLVAIFVFLLDRINKKDNISINGKENQYADVMKKDEKKDEEKHCDEKGECTTIVNCNSKERIFNNNLRDIKDAAVSYFTNERLPKSIGEKITLSLDEMQEKKLVLSVIDSNDNTCDTDKTYVEVTKEKNEYVMKINLSCTDMEDYIIIHLGCYDYCKDMVCEKQDENGVKEFEYQYKKVTSCTMSEWSSWGEWQTTREKATTYKKEDIKVITSTKTHKETKDAIKSSVKYNCDKYGSDYKLENDKCVKVTTVKDVVDATVSSYSYNCNNYPGYKLNGTVCEKSKTVTDTIDAVKGSATYYCENGYKLNGTKCETSITVTDTKPATANPRTYSCSAGYTLSGTTCYRMVDKTDTKDAIQSCASGYSLSNGSCVKKYQEKETINATANPRTYSCSAGYTLSGTTCYRMVDKTDTTSATITCPSGYSKSGTKCSKTTYSTDTISATPVYTYQTVTVEVDCRESQGTTKLVYKCTSNGCGMVPETSYEYVWTKCPQQESVQVLDYYDCPSGYSRSGSTCTSNVSNTHTINATITCPNGYSKSGTTCTKKYQEKETINATANPITYSCSAGYTLSGTTCYRMVDKTDTKDVIKSCATGYSLTNGKCVKKYQEKETINATANPITYSCESGFTKTSDNKCIKNYQKTQSIDAKVKPAGYSCKSGYTLNGTKCSKTVTTVDKKNATKVSGGYVCKNGYTLNGKKCEKIVYNINRKDPVQNPITYSCSSGYTLEGKKCTKVVTEEVKTTYYRYATRTCDGGTTDIKWSTSNNDKTLLDDGYSLTGQKREITTANDVLDK